MNIKVTCITQSGNVWVLPLHSTTFWYYMLTDNTRFFWVGLTYVELIRRRGSLTEILPTFNIPALVSLHHHSH